jgi:hypothetical protein
MIWVFGSAASVIILLSIVTMVLVALHRRRRIAGLYSRQLYKLAATIKGRGSYPGSSSGLLHIVTIGDLVLDGETRHASFIVAAELGQGRRLTGSPGGPEPESGSASGPAPASASS